MERYDPKVAPESKEWLALDEGERTLLVEQYHRDARIELPKHARSVHAIGSVLIEYVHDLLHSKTPSTNDHAPYYAALLQLTPERWRDG